MKKILVFFIGLVAVFFCNTIQAQGVDAYFYAAPFYAPGQGPYLETYIAIAGNSVNYLLNEDSTLQASVEITMLFKNVDEVKEFRKYNIVSPPLSNTTNVFPSFIDIQRIAIPQGIYNFELIIHDNYAPDTLPDYKIIDIISVNFPENEIAYSGVQFLERFKEKSTNNIFVKNGYECVPYVSNFFPDKVKYLRFYIELYNAAKELGPLEDFLFLVHIEKQNTSKPIKELSSFSKEQAKNVNVFIKEININKLPTGNYYLVFEVRDRENKLVLSKKKFFQRSRHIELPTEQLEIDKIEINATFAESFVNIDSLKFAMKCLYPICDQSEIRFIENQLEANELKLMQQFFYSFWFKRDENAPQQAWNEYFEKVKHTHQQFGDKLHPGFNTDRGRVFLQYGPANSVVAEKSESNAYPYEMWHYYRIADQTNIKFIFYNRDLSGNNYTLLHSTMRGEINYPNWESEIYSRTGNNTGRAKRIFNGE